MSAFTPHGASGAASLPPLRLRVAVGVGAEQQYRFTQPFRIGRADSCEVVIQHDYVSRTHVEVTTIDGGWWLRDLKSGNGVLENGQRVDAMAIRPGLTVRLGLKGPFLIFDLEPEPQVGVSQPSIPPASEKKPASDTETMADLHARYFSGAAGADQQVSDRTMFIRQTFQQIQKKQRFKHRWTVAALGVLILAAGGIAWYQRHQLNQRQAIAENLFYSMKTLQVEIAGVENILLGSNNPQQTALIRRYRTQRKQLEGDYDNFLEKLKVYSKKLSEEDRLLLRVTRIFGECELTMPKEYVTEVHNYIGKWRGSNRYATAIALAKSKGYDARIVEEFLSAGLPPQFFYLAMQESGFDPFASGPQTYMGIAKGMWQFIPKTGAQYGLTIGPLLDMKRADPGDDRHDWIKATRAATRYIKDLYSTDAQASGLLVMASYNWGEQKVLPLIRSMPSNPRERNFWQLLTKYRDKFPPETYDYVFYIVSAAVIGENPKLFGFDFDNPLAAAEKAH